MYVGKQLHHWSLVHQTQNEVSPTANISAQTFKEVQSSMHHSRTDTLHVQQVGLETELEFLHQFLKAQTQKMLPFKKYRPFCLLQ